MHSQRIEKLRERMEAQDIPALLVSNAMHRRYLTGFTGSAGVVLVTGQTTVLFTDFRYRTQAPAQVKGSGVTVMEHGVDMLRDVEEELQRSKLNRLGFEAGDISYRDYQKYKQKLSGVTLVATDGLVEQLRQLKDETEQQIMVEAAQVADEAYEYILGELQPDVTEKEIQNKLEFFMRSRGADGSSFDTIVASGERSALPHGVASDKKLRVGELITLDYGAYYQGYCSDITRTVMLGEPTEQQREIYEIVLEAQTYAVARIEPGMSGKQADALAREIIKKRGYGEYFGHGTGHGLGMEVHESPRLSPRSEDILKPGMVVTVEPGIYLPGVGGVRIEDDVLVTEKGAQRLTQSDKSLKILKL